MGLTYADITLVNHGDLEMVRRGLLTEDKVRKTDVRALVDTGAITLVINETIYNQLGLFSRSTQPAELADGSIHRIPVAEGVEVRFENRDTRCDAFVMPGNGECLLGAIPIEGMDVLVDLRQQKLIVNPEHPYKPQFKIK